MPLALDSLAGVCYLGSSCLSSSTNLPELRSTGTSSFFYSSSFISSSLAIFSFDALFLAVYFLGAALGVFYLGAAFVSAFLAPPLLDA